MPFKVVKFKDFSIYFFVILFIIRFYEQSCINYRCNRTGRRLPG